jgi:uncharacterized protein
MDKEEALSLAQDYGLLLRSNLSIKGIWLYGSYAYGIPGKDSDIDVAVSLEHWPENYLQTEKLMFRLRRQVDIRIEPILIDPIKDRSGFSEMIEEKGIPLYPWSSMIVSGRICGNIASMKKRMRQVIVEPGEDGYYVVECPSLPGCLSQGHTKSEAIENIREAIAVWVVPDHKELDTGTLRAIIRQSGLSVDDFPIFCDKHSICACLSAYTLTFWEYIPLSLNFSGISPY